MGVVCLIIKVTGKLQIYGPLKKKKIWFELHTNHTLQKVFFSSISYSAFCSYSQENKVINSFRKH